MEGIKDYAGITRPVCPCCNHHFLELDEVLSLYCPIRSLEGRAPERIFVIEVVKTEQGGTPNYDIVMRRYVREDMIGWSEDD